MFKLNKMSQVVTVSPRLTWAEYEARLNTEGMTSGYRPMGGDNLSECISERIPNLYFLKYGGIEDLCVGGKILLPSNSRFTIKPYPRAATGPDLRCAVLGSKDILGTFEEISFKVFPNPDYEIWGAFFLEYRVQAHALLRDMIGLMIKPLFLSWDASGRKWSRSDTSVLLVKLSGVRRMVLAYQEALSQLAQGQKIAYEWVSNPKVVHEMNNENITEAAFKSVLKEFGDFWGGKKKTFPLEGRFDPRRG